MKKKMIAMLLATVCSMSAAMQVTAAEQPSGDVNGDGVFDIMDLICFQKWLLAIPDVQLICTKLPASAI